MLTLGDMVEVLRGVTDPAVISGLRRKVTRDDVLAFALAYLPHHLQLDNGTISLSPIHEEWVEYAESWDDCTDDLPRDIFVSPRGAGKSTWMLLVIPLWAAATGRVRFIASFSDSGTQAETHLASVKYEMDHNARLRQDYPDLCRAGKRPGGVNVGDNRGLLFTAAGVTFAARGVDSSVLGLKVGDQRPDLLIIDDPEPTGSNYSIWQAKKRQDTLTDAILPMGSDRCRTVMTGTTVMQGSLIHQATMHVVDPARWVTDEHFRVHHALPFDEAGESIWPERWSTAYLRSIQHTSSFAKNWLNAPVPGESEYWTTGDFRYGLLEAPTRVVLSIDPAVSTKRTSDRYGLAVVAYSPSEDRCEVRVCFGARMRGSQLRERVLHLLTADPSIRRVLVETNQGGELWTEILHDLPIPVYRVHQFEKKEVRAARCLTQYQAGKVLHNDRLVDLESEMLAFPGGLHDDLVDAVGTAVHHLLTPAPRGAQARTTAYA